MCGFAGVLTSRPEADVRGMLTRMLSSLSHRGPDGSGIEVLEFPAGRRLGLAHARLAVLDPTPVGRQPMRRDALWTAFNGEIYNHLGIRRRLGDVGWKSLTDTETLLAAWARDGEAALADLRGIFAFALADPAAGRLWLVRDHLGVKPLYVAEADDGTRVFASEIRSVLASGAVGRAIDPAAVRSLLSFGSAVSPRTPVSGISMVGAGEVWAIAGGTGVPAVRRYWAPRFAERGSLPSSTKEQAVEGVRHLLGEACGLQLLSDVPLAAFLSGGIDSSAMVEAATRGGGDLRTFSVSFEEREFDESAYAAEVARAYGATHRKIVLTAADVLGHAGEAFAAYDSPSYDGLNTWFISRAVRRAGVTVALSGLGGDELFAGYGYHRMMARLDAGWMTRLIGFLPPAVDRRGPRWEKLREAAGAGTLVARYFALRRVMSRSVLEVVLSPDAPAAPPFPADVASRLEAEVAPLDPVNAFSLLDMKCYMHDTLLRDTDQMSMSHALEVRVPLLDHKLVEFVAGLPGDWKLETAGGAPGKGLLVRAVRRPLPAAGLARPKMGFVFPWRRWLRSELRPIVREAFDDGRAAEACLLDGRGLADVERRFAGGDPRIREADILGLTCLLRWTRRNLLERPAAVV